MFLLEITKNYNFCKGREMSHLLLCILVAIMDASQYKLFVPEDLINSPLQERCFASNINVDKNLVLKSASAFGNNKVHYMALRLCPEEIQKEGKVNCADLIDKCMLVYGINENMGDNERKFPDMVGISLQKYKSFGVEVDTKDEITAETLGFSLKFEKKKGQNEAKLFVAGGPNVMIKSGKEIQTVSYKSILTETMNTIFLVYLQCQPNCKKMVLKKNDEIIAHGETDFVVELENEYQTSRNDEFVTTCEFKQGAKQHIGLCNAFIYGYMKPPEHLEGGRQLLYETEWYL